MGGMVFILASDIAPEAVVLRQVILAQAPATKTPFPTFTPDMPSGFNPVVALQASPTNTLVPTWTPSITPTPLPTNTPLPT